MLINDLCPKHTKWNPSFPPGVSRDLLAKDYLKEYWFAHNFKDLPMFKNKDQYSRSRTYVRTEQPDFGHSSREWAQHCFVSTFGMYTNDLFLAKKYLEYMAAFDSSYGPIQYAEPEEQTANTNIFNFIEN